MNVNSVCIAIMTAFWGVVGIGLPWLVPRSPNRGTIQIMLSTTAMCCYLFWMMAFLHQMNPLFGPVLKIDTLRYMSAGDTWRTL
ncbi:unnamed protein product [Soboliphyme baturini]|uniref:V-type proton ATPase subunit n=1 Tax=Soboliphyme baturini TaxID=241478 RepID=A0A183ITZ2_9BILA|nr:unnamed protein product [Soboliphyme baturini]